MNTYIEILFTDIPVEKAEQLIAQLSDAGFEGFEEEGGKLRAYIPAAAFDKEPVEVIAAHHSVSYTQTEIEETNWNQLWESGFEPVLVHDFVAIRAHFHEMVAGMQHEIVITPKMSFGTGHHATTFQMIELMRELDFSGKRVLDFGTGTGVLAILAEKMGAVEVIAIDHDEWSIENAAENFARNDCKAIRLFEASHAGRDESFDIILANINKNIILDNLAAFTQQLRPGGHLLLSGLLEEDEADLLASEYVQNLAVSCKMEKHNWLALRLWRS